MGHIPYWAGVVGKSAEATRQRLTSPPQQLLNNARHCCKKSVRKALHWDQQEEEIKPCATIGTRVQVHLLDRTNNYHDADCSTDHWMPSVFFPGGLQDERPSILSSFLIRPIVVYRPASGPAALLIARKMKTGTMYIQYLARKDRLSAGSPDSFRAFSYRRHIIIWRRPFLVQSTNRALY